MISTHTLTWSVTVPIKDSTATIIDFNSHAHVERDIVQVQLSVHVHNFNSHAHVERDAEVSENSYIHMDFNSHAHVERDVTILC